MNRATVLLIIMLLVATPLVGCMVHRHTIGNGGTGATTVTERQWYVLWGLLPLNGLLGMDDVDAGTLAGDQTDYTIVSEFTVIDFVINIFTSMVTVYARSVSVTY